LANAQHTIESIFKKKYKQFCLLSYHFVEDMYEAEDIVQDVFIQLLSHKNRAAIKSLEAYIKVAIKNNSIQALKKKRSFESLNQLLKEPESLLTEDQLEEEKTALIKLQHDFYEALAKLPKECRTVFLLTGLNGMKYKDTAEELGISINTVKSQMKKAYKAMRSSLEHLYLFLATNLTKTTC